jgi:hypothetical protein
MVTLRVSGASFDVNLFLREFQIAPALIFLRGQPKYPETQPNGPVLDHSGMNVDVSDAEFGDLEQQSHDTVRFLADNLAMMERMSIIQELKILNWISQLAAAMVSSRVIGFRRSSNRLGVRNHSLCLTVPSNGRQTPNHSLNRSSESANPICKLPCLL